MRLWLSSIVLIFLIAIIFTDERFISISPEHVQYVAPVHTGIATTTSPPEPPVEKNMAPVVEQQSEPVQPKPLPAPSPESIAPPPPNNLATEIEEEILQLTNAERAASGAGALAADARLHHIAWAHSADMIARNFFAHESPDGCSSSCRADKAGYTWRTIGENLYMMSGFNLSPPDTAAMVVEGWMHSPGHRANLVNDAFTHIGVGVITVGDSVYVTALYAKPR